MNRRSFLHSVAVAGVASRAAAAPARRQVKLGLDNYAVRGMKWKAPALVDYAASLKTDSLFITDLDAFERLDDGYLRDVRKRAADKGLQIHLGTWSVCPTSVTFKKTWGSAEEHLALAIRVAKALGSPVARVVLGSAEDRRSPGGIRARIHDTVAVLKACRSRAVDAGVKIAVENHAGDMQSHEIIALVEEAGKDHVGINYDSGNAAWTLEDPVAAFEAMAPYVVTTSLRDSAIWESERGATVQWTAMGDGIVDLPRLFDRFVALCPGVPVHIETISGGNREFPFLDPAFWAPYAEARGAAFARFLTLAKKGKARLPWTPPPGRDRATAERDYQRAEVERSIRYCKQALGLGLQA